MSSPSSAPRAPRWYVVLAVLVGLSAWYYFSPAKVRGPTVIRGPIMGTTFTVKLADGLSPSAYAKAEQAVWTALNAVNDRMSTYIPESEVSRFAGAPAGVPFALSASTVEVVQKALAISAATDGAFDVTVRPLVDAWGFGPDGRPERKPGADATSALLQRIGYDKLRLDAEKKTLTKTTSSVSIDLSAIAKGYAVDRVAAGLEALGHRDYLVEVGGEMRARGQRGAKGVWRVGIESPKTDGRSVARVIALKDRGLATSGNYRNFYMEDGVRYAHTIDPKSGQPVRHRLQSVSVIHPESAMADGWATALMVLGEAEAIRVSKAEGLAALFMISGEDGGIELEMTDAFKPFLVNVGDE
ncbi:MAG: FAD:protein FMN transferase [Myxococcota bacterium]